MGDKRSHEDKFSNSRRKLSGGQDGATDEEFNSAAMCSP